LLLRPGFVAICESTRTNHESSSNSIHIQNGMVWKQIQQYDGNEFLISPYGYAFMLNVDWFQLFEKHVYSVGVIYLAVLNLPQNMRYKRENVILVWLIPGPTEPPLNINSYLAPLVYDLLLLWSEVSLHISVSEDQVVVKTALLAVLAIFQQLLKLPYFNPVCHLLIDPMHNLFLGTAKYVTQKIWIGMQLLEKRELDIIYKWQQQVNIPMHIGQLPSKIDSCATLTAEQKMIWTIYCSIYCLHGPLSESEIECWRHFVLACKRLCKRAISNHEITTADGLLLQFGKNYGPLNPFWLIISFEQYNNGRLFNQPTKNHCIEMQHMNRFHKDNLHLELIHLAETMPLFDDFGPFVSQHAKSFQSTATTSEDYDIVTDFSELLLKFYAQIN
uniref:Uncharacterized protein n=1 Tax=Amphimedon queenslandica TaxID=400682 RepID=A0A1X7URQ6_AMPQE